MKRVTYTKYVPDPAGEMSMEVEPLSGREAEPERSERRAGSPLAKS